VAGKRAAKLRLDDVAAFASSLPDVTVGTKWGNRTWMVAERGFAWQRPLNKADLKRLGDTPAPAGDIIAVRVDSLDAKDALLAIAPPGFFTIEHFNGYPAVLIALVEANARDVEAAIADAWRTVAAKAKPRQARVAKNPAKARRPTSRKPPARPPKARRP
jgi:hypothetical protein